jgi:signal transduction histidine kinase
MGHRLRELVETVWILPLVLLLFTQWEVWLGGLTNAVGPNWVTALSGGIGSALLLGRRAAPLLTLVLVACIQVGPWLVWGAPESGSQFAVSMAATFAVGRWCRRPKAWLGLPIVIAMTLAQVALDPMQLGVASHWGWSLFGVVAWSVGAWLRQHAEVDVRRDAELRAVSRAELAEERLRIARDLHDVIATSLGVIVVHAEAAEELIGGDPARATKAMRRVQTTGREALAEVREILGSVRERGAISPDLDDLDALVERMRGAGLPVSYERRGDFFVPADRAEVLYRLAQEALTNVIRHAGLVATHVQVVVEANDVTMEVKDDAPPRPGPHRPPIVAGNGISGMRERVQALGGTLEVRTRSTGGVCLSSRLPIAPPS